MRSSKKYTGFSLLGQWAFLLILFAGVSMIHAQQDKADSLFTVLKTAKADTVKVNLLNALAMEYRNNDPDTSVYFSNQALILATRLSYGKGRAESFLWRGTALTNTGDYTTAIHDLGRCIQLITGSGIQQTTAGKQLLARAYNNEGIAFRSQGNYPEALKYYSLALKIKQELGDKKSIADSYNNIGVLNEKQGDFPGALKNYLLALELREASGDKKGISMSLHNIGGIYLDLTNYSEALNYFTASVKMKLEINDRQALAADYNGIGSVYDLQDKNEKAMENYGIAVKIAEETGNKTELAGAYNNMAGVYGKLGDNEKALKYYMASLELKEEMNNPSGIAISYTNIGFMYLRMKKAREARPWFEKGLALSLEIGNRETVQNSYVGLAHSDSLTGNAKEELKNYKLYITYRDSIFNEENTKKTVQAEMNYEFDKKEAAAKLEQEKKEAISAAESKKQKIIIFSVCGILILVLAFAIFAYRSFLQKRKANVEITQQKHLIEEKQKEILDSIYYARRIQRSLLTNEKYIARNLERLNK